MFLINTSFNTSSASSPTFISLKGVIVKSTLKLKELKQHHYLEKKFGIVTGINQLAAVIGYSHYNPMLSGFKNNLVDIFKSSRADSLPESIPYIVDVCMSRCGP